MRQSSVTSTVEDRSLLGTVLIMFVCSVAVSASWPRSNVLASRPGFKPGWGHGFFKNVKTLTTSLLGDNLGRGFRVLDFTFVKELWVVWSLVGKEFSANVWGQCQPNIMRNLGRSWFVVVIPVLQAKWGWWARRIPQLEVRPGVNRQALNLNGVLRYGIIKNFNPEREREREREREKERNTPLEQNLFGVLKSY